MTFSPSGVQLVGVRGGESLPPSRAGAGVGRPAGPRPRETLLHLQGARLLDHTAPAARRRPPRQVSRRGGKGKAKTEALCCVVCESIWWKGWRGVQVGCIVGRLERWRVKVKSWNTDIVLCCVRINRVERTG